MSEAVVSSIHRRKEFGMAERKKEVRSVGLKKRDEGGNYEEEVRGYRKMKSLRAC